MGERERQSARGVGKGGGRDRQTVRETGTSITVIVRETRDSETEVVRQREIVRQREGA